LWGERGHGIVRRGKLSLLFRAALAYPLLVWRFLTAPRPEIVLVPYPGHFDMPLLALLCRIRGTPVVFDAFVSLYDTVISDRKLADPGSLLARLTKLVDRLACRTADLVLTDTPQHVHYLSETTGVPVDRFRVVWVGAEEEIFHPRPQIEPDPALVLFYGTFIPLHGMETIVRAAAALEGEGIRFRIIGDGQERPVVDRLQEDLAVRNIERVDWVPLERLPEEIAGAGVCLGIFGTTGKADRVVPNKVYQCVATGRPVVTGDTRAIREAFEEGEVVTVPVGDPGALAEAIRQLRRDPRRREEVAARGRRRFLRDYDDASLASLLRNHLTEVRDGLPGRPSR
ncbi:MAG TPA: glycosyltransferase, partial [Longimicrobiales bacterium]|nr:glycosyltransferase [Longimicrobiales bacterium]